MAEIEYREVETLRDPDGVICVITERDEEGRTYHSFAFMKEYERADGQTVRTRFMSRRHTPAIRRLTAQLEEWLDRAVERTQTARRAEARRR